MYNVYRRDKDFVSRLVFKSRVKRNIFNMLQMNNLKIKLINRVILISSGSGHMKTNHCTSLKRHGTVCTYTHTVNNVNNKQSNEPTNYTTPTNHSNNTVENKIST